MHLYKPFSLTVLTTPFSFRGKDKLVVVVGAMMPFEGGSIESEQNLWKLLPSLPGSNGSLDELKPKTRGEVLVLGSAHAPRGSKATVVATKVSIGPIEKELWAIGNRFWRGGRLTDPEPFESMPLDWAHAFGGEAYALNPLGKGLSPVDGTHPLPNLEIPGKLVKSPADRPDPAGYCALDPSWPQRARRAGTYDKKWLDTRYPDPPDDLDPTFYNTAPPDQWIAHHFSGTERFTLENFHPDKRHIEGRLPGLTPRVLATRVGATGMESVSMHCDTVVFIPEREKLILVWRGSVDIVDEDASDLADLTVGLERLGEPRPVSHYAKVRAARADKKHGAVATLRDRDLVPEGIRPAKLTDGGDMEELLSREGLAMARARTNAQAQLDDSRQKLVDQGLDPDAHMPKTIPEQEKIDTSPDGLADLMTRLESEAETHKKRAMEQKDQAFADLRARCAERGLDADEILRNQEKKGGGPPKFSAKAELLRLRELAELGRKTGVPMPSVERLEDPELPEKLQETERVLLDAYRRFAHFLAPANALEGEDAARVREEVERFYMSGIPLSERDLTGASLSGLMLDGVDLSGALLEAADLRGVKLKGANLERAVLTRANLAGADLEGAKLAGANLGGADLAGANFREADMTDAVLHGASCAGTDFEKATLDRADLSEARFPDASLRGVSARDLVALRLDMERADLSGARLDRATFLEPKLRGARFDEATLEGMLLLDADAAGASFVRAHAKNLRAVKAERGTTLEGADFRGADLRMANLRGVLLSRAKFTDARLDGAELSSAELDGADLEGAQIVEARLIKTNLTEANLARADLMNALMPRAVIRGARFDEASLFQADMAKVVGDDKTSFRDANVNRVRHVKERRDG